MFYDDAETASRVLGLTLTSRNNGGAADVPLAGVPVKAAGDYVRRLVQQGFRVAICEQIEDPKVAKGVVRREVIETVTPGRGVRRRSARRRAEQLHLRDSVAAEREAPTADARVGVAAADVSTGEVRLIVTTVADLDPLMARLAPREILVPSARARGCPRRAATRSSRSARRGSSTRRSRAKISRSNTACCRSRDSASTPTDTAHRRRGRRAASLSARAAAGRPAAARAADHRAAGRRDAARRDDATQSRAGRVAARRRHRRHAALRARSHGDADGRAAPAAVDPRAAHRSRGDRCAARRRRDVRRRSDRARSAARRDRRRARRRATRGESGGGPKHAARAPRARRFARRAARGRDGARRVAARGTTGRDVVRLGRRAGARGAPLCGARRAAADRDRRRRDDRGGRRRRARRAARAARRRQGRDRADSGRRAHANGHPVAQGRLQQGLRLLHRGHELQPAPRARRTISAGRRSRRASAS